MGTTVTATKVVGYFALRDQYDDPDPLHRMIRAHARTRGLHLVSIEVDRRALTAHPRPAFGAALDRAARERAAILVPSLRHLSPNQLVRDAIMETLATFRVEVISLDAQSHDRRRAGCGRLRL